MARNAGAARRLPEPQVDDDEDGEPQRETTVREDLLAARDEVLGVDDEPPAGGEPSAAADDAAGRQPRPGDRAEGGEGDRGDGRNARGRFARPGQEPAGGGGQPAAAGPASPAGGPAAPAQGGAQPAAPPAGAQPGAAPDLRLAPQGWTNENKALWPQLPEKVRAQIHQREADIHKALTSQDGERALGKEFGGIVNNYQDVLQASGVHPLRYFDDVLRIMRVITRGSMAEKVAMLQGVAARNGIDFRQVIRPAGGAPAPAGDAGQPPGAPPAASPPGGEAPAWARQLMETVSSTANWQRTFEEGQRRAAQEARAAMERDVMTEIQAFQVAPEHRFFAQVRDHMTALLNGGVARDLEDAYQQAIYARPDIRAAIKAEEDAAARAAADKAARVRSARLRGGSVRGGTGGAPPEPAPGSKGSVRDDIRAAMAEVASANRA